MAEPSTAPSYPQPQRLTGALSGFRYIESTPAVGREYADLQLSSILDNDEMVRDMAITASERGVVLFNDQDITPAQLKQLVIKLGKLTGNPPESGLHRHPFPRQMHDHLKIPEVDDPDLLIISSVTQKKTLADPLPTDGRKFASWGWHSDESHEKYPPAYTGFKIAKSPPTGGDTLFVSSYGLYEHLSEPWQKFAEGLTATHSAEEYLRFAEKGMPLDGELQRGHPENVGIEFKNSHPVVRTNPVTGWKGLFGVGFGLMDGRFDNMTEHESNILKEYFLRKITDASDLQLRKRWNDNGVAIWDNDVVEGERLTFRVAGIGEKPYYDPNSTSRAEYLRKRLS
ncbi:hypothetical protein BJY00DRAFT_321214 [Aspergillus carlsbadensis]|nr:hypothetical protein BJY00DRAFT_321214 [Aspergillus carlsbadensis]